MSIEMARLGSFISFLCLFGLFNSVQSACYARKVTPFCLYSTHLPTAKERFLPSIGNGYVATIVMSDTIHIAGVYNGKANISYTKRGGHYQPASRKYGGEFVAYRARVSSPISVNFTLDVPGTRSYALDVEEGVFYQWFDSEKVHIEQKIYAHRKRLNIIVNEITVKTSIDFYMNYETNSGSYGDDIDMTMQSTSGQRETESGPIEYPEIEFTTNVAVAYTHIPKGTRVYESAEEQTFRFIAALSTNMHTPDPVKKCKEEYDRAIGANDLFTSHAAEWKKIWRDGNITITGDMYISQLVPSSLYYLLSQVNEHYAHGVSPGGLAGGKEYLGHVFWDQDVWMYPSILMLHPNIARALLQYRQERVKAAQMIAKRYGYKGAMYPWESALSGYEVCPEYKYGFYELHINGDIAFAQRQFYFATHDHDWLKKHGYEVIFQTASFWASRVKYEKHRDHYVINDVMPPDEYAHRVNNSIYTNTIAKINLETAIKLGRLLKKETPKVWERIASKLYLPFDPWLQYHPEYEHFNVLRTYVKQADAILINYPLMADIPKRTKENDLRFYARMTNPNGPAMTHSMFAIGWLDVGNKEKASQEFKRNYENIKGPFKVWSELRSGKGATNFMTGAGGFLQSVLFGYGGLRLKEDGLYFKLQLPPDSKSLVLNGVKYMANSLKFEVTSCCCYVLVLEQLPSYKQLYIKHAQYGKTRRMTTSKKISICRGMIFHKE